MAYDLNQDSTATRFGSIEWAAQRVRDAIVFAAGIGLALPLILPFA